MPRPASHWNFTGEPGLVTSSGPGGGRSFRKAGISGQVVGNAGSCVTGVPATLTKNRVSVANGPTDWNVETPGVVGAWTRTSARFPAASVSPAGPLGGAFGTWPLRNG